MSKLCISVYEHLFIYMSHFLCSPGTHHTYGTSVDWKDQLALSHTQHTYEIYGWYFLAQQNNILHSIVHASLDTQMWLLRSVTQIASNLMSTNRFDRMVRWRQSRNTKKKTPDDGEDIASYWNCHFGYDSMNAYRNLLKSLIQCLTHAGENNKKLLIFFPFSSEKLPEKVI